MDHPDRPAAGPGWSELVRAALLDRVGLQGGQEPGMEVGQDQENRPGAHLPALAGAVGGDAAGPGLWHQSGRRQRAKDCAGQPAGAPQSLSRTGYGGAAIPAPLPVAQAKTDRQRHPPRHRLAAAVAAPGPPLEPGLAAARTLAGTQAQPGGHPPCPRLKTPYLPLSGGGGIRALVIVLSTLHLISWFPVRQRMGGAGLPSAHAPERSGPRRRNSAPSSLVRWPAGRTPSETLPSCWAGQLVHTSRPVCYYCVFSPHFPCILVQFRPIR